MFQFFSCRKTKDLIGNELTGLQFNVISDPTGLIVLPIQFKFDGTILAATYTGNYTINDELNPSYPTFDDRKWIKIVKINLEGRSTFDVFEGYYKGEYTESNTGQRSVEGNVYSDPEYTDYLGRFSALSTR